MNREVLFDLVHNFHDPDGKENYPLKVKGKQEIMLNHREQGRAIVKSIQAFIHSGSVEVSKDVRIQAFTGSSDLPSLTKDVFNITQQVDNFDQLWALVFKGVPLKRGQLSWEIADVNSGQDFKLIPEGGKVEFFGITGSKVIIDVDKFGMGIGVTWETLEGRKLYLFWDQLMDVRAKMMGLWADVHYGLLATAGTSNPITFQAGTGTLDRDIATLNKGAEELGETNKDKGFGDTANARLTLFASPKLRARLNQALRVTSADLARAGNQGQVTVDQNIDPRYTYNTQIPVDKALLVLPGQKIQNSVYLREKSFSKEQMESMSQVRTYWTAFGATVADTDQVFELSFS